MDELALILFKCSLAGYAAGAVMGLLLLRFEKLATVFGFGIASLSALCGLVSSVISLAGGGALSNASFPVLPSLIPYVQFSVRLDALSLFFVMIVSLLGCALSIYSLGYVRGFYGRKNVGVLGAFFNAL